MALLTSGSVDGRSQAAAALGNLANLDVEAVKAAGALAPLLLERMSGGSDEGRVNAAMAMANHGKYVQPLNTAAQRDAFFSGSRPAGPNWGPTGPTVADLD